MEIFKGLDDIADRIHAWRLSFEKSDQKREERIFIGLVDIASQIDDWKEGFEANGIKVLTATKYIQSPLNKSKINIILNNKDDVKKKFPLFKPRRISTRIKPFWDAYVEKKYNTLFFDSCDIFFFVWSTFKEDYSDLIELKKRGKKIINLFVGDEVRWYPAMKQEFEQYNLPPIEYQPKSDTSSINALSNRLRYLRIVEKYSDLIIFLQAPTQSQLALRPFYSLPILLRTHEIVERTEQRKIPIILHAPSENNVKGTKYIIEALEKLKNENIAFEYKLLHNIPNEEILKIYTECDILVGQLFIPGGGKQELEALAAGMIVLSSAMREYPQLYQHNSPIIEVGPDTVYEELKRVILDLEMRKELAKKGRPFVEQFHNPRKICERVLQLLNTVESERQYDFYPSFFREKFIPESEEKILFYNKWTNYVKDCDWYKTYIKPGERAGFKF